MNINVVGAGPAALYFAIKLKQSDPSINIKMFEKEARESNAGLGYVIQQELVNTLCKLDRSLYKRIEDSFSATWEVSVIKAKEEDQINTFRTSFGIKRSVLVNALRELAKEKNIDIEYESKINTHDISRLKSSCDILVGADGLSSIVRSAFKEELGAKKK